MLAEKTVCVLLVRGEDPDGAPIYAYVGVRADKLKEFMDAQNSGMFYPEDMAWSSNQAMANRTRKCAHAWNAITASTMKACSTFRIRRMRIALLPN